MMRGINVSTAFTRGTVLPRSPVLRQRFAPSRLLDPNVGTVLSVREPVEQTRAVVARDGRQVMLLGRIASGGEGTVFETDQPGLVCKVYHENRLTVGAQKKIALMESLTVSQPGVCWPTSSVMDRFGTFRGFLMPSASGEPLGHGLFIPTVWLRRRPNWTRRESAALAIQVLRNISHLHSVGVLLGDINPMNILVRDENTIYFVDCDSYQVREFPCPVGATNFVAPEIQRQDFGRFLRTIEHELFAVATLVFMILMPGKPPYSHQGGSDGAANIRKMHFPYPLGEKRSDGAPAGAWRFCWSHLTRPLKEAFHHSFDASFRGQPRVEVQEWINLLGRYHSLLSRPAAVFRGPKPDYGFDLSILPQNYRYVPGVGHELPTGGSTDLQRSVRRMAVASSAITSGYSLRHATSPRRQLRSNQPYRQGVSSLQSSRAKIGFFQWLFS